MRLIIEEYVTDFIEKGKLSPSINPDTLKGKAFRASIDLGPLSSWLDDSDVTMIRITGPESISLLKNEEWVDAPNGYLSKEDLAEAVRCLGAGMEIRDGETPGISWFRLEEGYMAFTALLQGIAPDAAIVIDKTAATDPRETLLQAMGQAARAILEESIESMVKIAVVGTSSIVRQTILRALVTEIPTDSFIVSVDDLPLVTAPHSKHLRLSLNRLAPGGKRSEKTRNLLFHASGLEPAWLTVSGTTWDDIPHLLTAASNRLGVIAELPLSAIGRLDRELMAVLAAEGTAINEQQAAALLEEAFDLIVIVGREPNGTPVIDEIQASAVDETGHWMPQPLFTRTRLE